MATVIAKSNAVPKVDAMVSGLLGCLTNIRLYHWQTQSYAQHQALGSFYDELSDLLDGFVEQYQGRYVRLALLGSSIESPNAGPQPTEYLQVARDMVEAERNRADFPQDSALQNVVDEIVGAFDRTIYKLRFLK